MEKIIFKFGRASSVFLTLLCCLGTVSGASAQGSQDLPKQDIPKQEMPKIEGESLAGPKVILPDAASGRVAVLVFGFSKASKGPTSDWAKKTSANYANQPSLALYQLPVLEDVPRFIRGMVISGMRKGVAENMRDHFVPILQGEMELKKLVSYKEPDDAYLVVLDRTGKIDGQMHGPLTDARYSGLRAEIDSLLNGPK